MHGCVAAHRDPGLGELNDRRGRREEAFDVTGGRGGGARDLVVRDLERTPISLGTIRLVVVVVVAIVSSGSSW